MLPYSQKSPPACGATCGLIEVILGGKNWNRLFGLEDRPPLVVTFTIRPVPAPPGIEHVTRLTGIPDKKPASDI